MKRFSAALLLALLPALLPAGELILFIRGGSGTVGFFEGGADEQGADIDNFATNGGNHGWGELSAALRAEGFAPEQVAENPVNNGVPTPIPLDTLDLSEYAIIVFGSNNAEYTTAQVDAFMDYIADGGAALFISDANFGQNWGDAPSSDQHFLTRFGLTMNQDRGTYTVDRGQEFLVPTHPIFNGVDTFDGEGVSPITVTSTVSGVTPTILSSAPNGFPIRRNTGASQGPSTTETEDDGTLVVATYGDGRIAGHFDRNTFFNLNGAGTNINRFDNEAFARNLFNWLADKPDFDPGTDNYAPRLHFTSDTSNLVVPENTPFSLSVVAKDPDGTIGQVSLLRDAAVLFTDTAAPFSLTIPALTPGTHVLIARATDNEGKSTDQEFEITVQDASSLPQPLNRSTWTLTSNRSVGELGNAIDNNAATRWPTRQFQQPGQWIRINLGSVESFDRIVIETLANPDDYPRGYVVRGSNNGSTFEDLASGAGSGATTEIILPQAVSYQHIEIEQTGTSSNRWWSIHELNVYATPDQEPPNPPGIPTLTEWLDLYYPETPDPLDIDGDGDGVTTLAEFAANTNPTDPTSKSPYTSMSGIDRTTNTPYIKLTFRRWTVANGLAHSLHGSQDLATWNGDDYTVTEIGEPVPNGDGTETVTWRISFPENAEKGFARMEISRL